MLTSLDGSKNVDSESENVMSMIVPLRSGVCIAGLMLDFEVDATGPTGSEKGKE